MFHFIVYFPDFCDIPELMKHLQDNYSYWKDEEENPTVNYDLTQAGQGQKDSSKNSDTGSNKNSNSDSESKSGETT